MLDRVFDHATVFMMKYPSFRGEDLFTYSVEAMPKATKLRQLSYVRIAQKIAMLARRLS